MKVLAAQSFSGNLLVRGIGEQRLVDILSSTRPQPQFLLVSERKVSVVDPPSTPQQQKQQAPQLAWRSLDQVAAVGLHRASLEAETFEGPGADGANASLPIYMLGQDTQSGCVRLAVDVSALGPGLAEQQHLNLTELHGLMLGLPDAELAMAGHAVALSQWHNAHRFCARCGAPTESVEGGARRQCTAHESHKHYPRTDPVVIMLVESPDGSKALLGRSRKHRPGMLTALAGFIDQGESIEEAVAREVLEESGVRLSRVDIVGSQPWPIGRGGSCELMIGCIAKAATEELHVDYSEMEEVRWVDRATVAAAVAAASDPHNPYLQPGALKDASAEKQQQAGSSAAGSGAGGASGGGVGFFIPPRYAIAHHLIALWATGRAFPSSSL